MATADTAREDLDNQALALTGRATELHYLARDYATNESTRNAQRHNGMTWVRVGYVLKADVDAVLREMDALAVACRDLPSFPAAYAGVFGHAARAVRAALDSLDAHPVPAE